MATKKKAKRKVQKALAPEEKTILENISSLTRELLGSDEEMVEDTEVMEEDYLEDEEEVEKASEGPTANPNEKAEDRVDQGTDITEDNYTEVGKSLQRLSRVVKSQHSKQSRESQMVMKSLAEIAKAMKSLSDRQNQTDTALSNIMDGIGLSDAVEKSSVQKNQEGRKPVANMDGNAVMQELASVLKDIAGQNQNSNAPNNWNVRKSAHQDLAQALPHIFKR